MALGATILVLAMAQPHGVGPAVPDVVGWLGVLALGLMVVLLLLPWR